MLSIEVVEGDSETLCGYNEVGDQITILFGEKFQLFNDGQKMLAESVGYITIEREGNSFGFIDA